MRDNILIDVGSFGKLDGGLGNEVRSLYSFLFLLMRLGRLYLPY